MEGILKKKRLLVVILTLILIVSISLTIKPVENPNFFQKIIQSIFVPIQTTVMKPINAVIDSINFFAEMKDYKIKNEKLIEENAILSEKIREYESYEKENNDLRELLNLSKKYEDRESLVASIISKEPGLWFNVFTVNRGISDGVKVDSVVLTHNGLVGKVTEVYENSSKVVSILDASNQIGAKITKTGELVTATGDINLVEKGLIKINYITSEIPLSEGDVIETSGIAGSYGIYPEGIYIGTVKEVDNDESSLLSKYATVETGVNFKTLREVIILK